MVLAIVCVTLATSFFLTIPVAQAKQGFIWPFDVMLWEAAVNQSVALAAWSMMILLLAQLPNPSQTAGVAVDRRKDGVTWWSTTRPQTLINVTYAIWFSWIPHLPLEQQFAIQSSLQMLSLPQIYDNQHWMQECWLAGLSFWLGQCLVRYKVNIFGFSYLIDLGYDITYDSSVEDAFVCKHPDFDQVKFQQTKEGLYVYKPTKDYIKAVAEEETNNEHGDNFLIKSVSENIEGFIEEGNRGG